jgi:hypothetical protein
MRGEQRDVAALIGLIAFEGQTKQHEGISFLVFIRAHRRESYTD